MPLKDELTTIISGIGQVTKGNAIQAVVNYIGKSKAAGTNAKEKELNKEQETALILDNYFKKILAALTSPFASLHTRKRNL